MELQKLSLTVSPSCATAADMGTTDEAAKASATAIFLNLFMLESPSSGLICPSRSMAAIEIGASWIG